MRRQSKYLGGLLTLRHQEITGLYIIFLACPLLFCGCSDKESADVHTPGRGNSKAGQASNEAMAHMRGQGDGGKDHPGTILYQKYCARCHNQPVSRAPHKSFLEMLPADTILKTMNEGVMQQMARELSSDERIKIVEYLVGSGPRQPLYPLVLCKGNSRKFDYDQPPFAPGWGIDLRNSRFIPRKVAQLNAKDISKLKLKWAFAYPNATRVRSQPTLVGGAVIVGSQDGTVYSLDSNSGCVRWTFRASAEVRTGITVKTWNASEKPVEPVIGYFADLLARVYAINLITGKLVWMTKVDDHPNATTTAQPVLYNNRVYATVSSLEVVPAADPEYACCSFRGSVVALDAGTGAINWKSYTIREKPVKAGVNSIGTLILAPSGAPSWNSPTVDVKRQRLYIGTGENYSSPAQRSSDSIIAFDIADGNIAWIRQTTKGDAWNLACMPFIPNKANCPVENGPDVDFGAPPILFDINHKDILVAGQKSGDVYGIEPGDGAIIWHQKIGRGGNQGGVHFGMAGEGDTVFIPMSDYDDTMLPVAGIHPGITALNALTGEQLWTTPADNICGNRKDCDPGISAAITAIPGVVFAGHMDGRLRAYDTKTGNVLWEYDTDRNFKTVSGEVAHGGSFGGGSGPIIANGRVYANSGYGIYFHMPGNVLLAFEVDD